MHTLALLMETCTYPFCYLMITAGYVINTFVIKDLFHPSIIYQYHNNYDPSCLMDISGHIAPQGCLATLILLLLPIYISGFAYMQSNRVVAGTDVCEAVEAEGQAAEDHKPVPQWRWVPAVWIEMRMSWHTWFLHGMGGDTLESWFVFGREKNQTNQRLWL